MKPQFGSFLKKWAQCIHIEMVQLNNLRNRFKIVNEKSDEILQDGHFLSSKMFRVVMIIVVTISVAYGISRAQISTPNIDLDPAQSFTGIYGTVVSMGDDWFSLDNTDGSKYEGVDVFQVDTSKIEKVETNDDSPVSISITDIKVGDKIIARGIINGNRLAAYNVISFSYIKTAEIEVASSPATTTATTTASANEISIPTSSTTTDEISTTTDSTSTDPVSIPEYISTSTDPALIETDSNTKAAESVEPDPTESMETDIKPPN
ncbi:MAG: hypothetical protein WCP09_00690 [Candidatus Taylorbacteria bacterium]